MAAVTQHPRDHDVAGPTSVFYSTPPHVIYDVGVTFDSEEIGGHFV